MLEALRPFIVTYASARTVEDFPDDVRALCGPPGQRPPHINLGLMVLDANVKLVRQVTPFIRPPAFTFDPEAQGKDFKRQVDQLLDGLLLPATMASVRPKLVLPDVVGTEALAGVRIYLTFGSKLAVVVEYADDSDEPQRVRGVCECVFPKHNPQGQVVERVRMTAAIESRPR